MATVKNAIGKFGRTQAEDFLYTEAEMLDDWRLMEWIDIITPDIDYRIPVRTTRESVDEARAFSPAAFHMVEDHASLVARMKRLDTGVAFSESPRTRARRHVSNVRVGRAAGSEVEIRSNLLFYWSRDELQKLVSAERRDTLRIDDGRVLLAKRTVLLDHTALPLPNLSIVL